MKIYYYLIPSILFISLIIVRQLLATASLSKTQKKEKKHSNDWKKLIDGQIPLRHKQVLWFTNSERLSAFCALMEQDDYRIKEATLLKENSSEIIEVMRSCKEAVSVGYFAFILLDIENHTDIKYTEYQSLLLDIVINGNIYSRENAINALFQCDDPTIALNTLLALNQKGIKQNEKLLEDSMLSFDGDVTQFDELLMTHFDQLNNYYKDIAVKYLELKNDHRWDDDLRNGLNDESIDTICSIIRLLSKKTCEENKKIMLDIMKKYSDQPEEKAAPAFVAATGLAMYLNEEEVFLSLKKALSSKHWQLRMNSAKSLVSLQQPKETLDQLLASDDQYARDALAYALEKK